MIHLKAPGRICLFGEHQDYLNFPVIAMAISKYIYLEAEKINEPKFQILLPDINESLEITLNSKELEYQSKRDYLRSGYNQFVRKRINLDKGYKIKITGDIPINAGASSSSALVIAWLSFLNKITGEKYNKFQIANLGYHTEVAEFGEAGGKMDFFSSVYGDLIHLDPMSQQVSEIPHKLNGFMLGNSLEKKKTVEDLRRVKMLSIEGFETLKEIMPNFDKFKSSLEDIDPFLQNMKKDHQEKIIGNIINRDITIEAKNLFMGNLTIFQTESVGSKKINNFYKQLGTLLTQHHVQLRENIGISTKKIDTMILNCLESGALGAKINGSGFGGTMFALSPGIEKDMKDSIEMAGGDAFMIKTSNGVDFN